MWDNRTASQGAIYINDENGCLLAIEIIE